ncbi:MAG TPA: REJ domain-containing protein, partial [Acidobacteriota bacterium]
GGGAFAPGVDLSLFDKFGFGIAPSWLVLEDFNGDGSPDIAVSQGVGLAVCILLGDGAGNFMDGLDAVCFDSVTDVIYMAGGLFSPNDLAVINTGGLADIVTILRNDTSGGLCAPGGGGTGQLQLSTKAVSDTSGDGLAQGGEVLTYFVTVRNSSAGPALGVSLVDPIPANTTYQSGSMKLNGAALTDAADGDAGTLVGGVNGSVQVMVGTVGAGASATVEFRVTVNLPAPASGTIITNSGTLDGLNTPPVVVSSQITVGTSTVENFTKSAVDANSNGIAQAGEQIVYTLTIRFDTPGTSYTGVVLTDAVPANTTLAAGTPVTVSFSPPGFTTASIATSGSGGANGRGTVMVSFADFVAVGSQSTATVMIRVVVDAGLPASVTAVVNQGVLSGNAGAVAFSEPSDDPSTTGLTNDPTILPTPTGVALNANAGLDFTVAEGATAMLNGTGSTGPAGFTYSWAQTAGSPTVALSGSTTSTPSFVAPLVNADAVLTFTLTVAFGGLTDSDTVMVTIDNLGNAAPVADAGPNQIVGNNQVVTLDGSGSFDPDSGPSPLSFSWVQTGGPAVSLAGAAGDSPTFVSPIVVAVTFLEFTLTVSDGLATDNDVVVIQVSPVAPACLIEVDQSVYRAGDVLVVRASTGGLGVVDIYIGIILPEFGYFTLSGAANAVSIVPNQIVPIETDWTLFTVIDFPVFTHFVTGSEPFGNYAALMIFTVPGGNPLEPTHRVCTTFDEWQILP